MRKIVLGAALAAAAVVLIPAATATTSKTVAVSITRTAFIPKTVTITAGDTVKWTNADTQNHQVACAKCPFTSPVLKPSTTYQHTFNTAGKFAITDPLHKGLKMTVSVTAAPKGVTLSASPRTVKFGSATTLTGTVSNNRSGENVILLSEECGAATFSHVTTTKTGTGGTFTVTDTPQMNTTYEAKWGTATSKAVKVKVRPRIRLAKIGSHKYSVRVKAAKPFAGKYVLFQKRTATGTWVKVKMVTLKSVSTIGTTTVTKATFRSRVRHHKKVRILMPSSQAAPCYVSGHSNTIKSY